MREIADYATMRSIAQSQKYWALLNSICSLICLLDKSREFCRGVRVGKRGGVVGLNTHCGAQALRRGDTINC